MICINEEIYFKKCVTSEETYIFVFIQVFR